MAHLRPIITRFFRVMLATMVVRAALGLVFLGLTGAPPPPVLLALPMAVPSIDAGRRYVLHMEKSPGMADGLRLTLAFFAANVGVMAILLFGGALSAGELPWVLGLIATLARPLAVFAVIWLVTIRAMIWFGSRMGF
ncbi:MAG: hypothetical protein AAF714_04930 [Pseudomonadota bacterium]